MESPGKHLKAERESQDLTLKEASESTKIREPLLRAIEGDRYDLISGPVYVKGFLEAYAGYLGLDPDEIILGYQKYLEHQTFSEGAESNQRAVSPKRRVKIWLLVISVIAIFGGAIWFILHPS
jgi:cytoskeletal protein RodZ